MSHQNLEAFITFNCFTVFVFSHFIGWPILFYLFTTRFWWFVIFYLVWMICDKNTPVTGGRQISFMVRAKLWKHVKNYFSSKLILDSDFTLDANRNYLFCGFPHGFLPIGQFLNLVVGESKLYQLYPSFKFHIATLHSLFLVPFIREWDLAWGQVSCSEVSLNYVLSKPEGGNIVNLLPGGTREMSSFHPKQYKFVVKKRKGFVRIALKNGASLVPVITFGENDLFKRVECRKIMGLQEFIRKIIGVSPMLFYGRGLRENWCGCFPRRKPLTTVVGKPIDVVKIENPTKEEIEKLHGIFTEELQKLFDTYKWEVLKNPESVTLLLE